MENSKLFWTLLFGLLYNQFAFSQTNKEFEQDYLAMRSKIINIGTVVNDTLNINGKKNVTKRFVSVGSGLMTYARYDTFIVNNIVTARHVISFFQNRNLQSIYLRPSWADTIRTTEYFGIEVPFINKDKTPNVFLYPDSNIDLGCILMLPTYYDKIYIDKIQNDGNHAFPYNSMSTPYLGDQVWIGGYPEHIQRNFQNDFLYCIATLKPGYISWKPSTIMTNTDLSHITLVESNATFGNSGGPVFSLQDRIELVGILVAGFDEGYPIYSNGKPLRDTLTNEVLIAKGRSGVSIIEKAEYVRKLIEFVQVEIDKQKKNGIRR